jgi:cytochrome c-type biogenesis protein CcmE
MKRKHKRLTFVVIALGLLGVAAGLVLSAFEENIVFFYSPTDIAKNNVAEGQRIRLGGLVEEGSVKNAGGAMVNFRVTDLTTVIAVTYKGLLPDLFSEGQGIVAEGTLQGGMFRADEVLAKHDETYMPPEVAESLKKSGKWKGPGESQGKIKRKDNNK